MPSSSAVLSFCGCSVRLASKAAGTIPVLPERNGALTGKRQRCALALEPSPCFTACSATYGLSSFFNYIPRVAINKENIFSVVPEGMAACKTVGFEAGPRQEKANSANECWGSSETSKSGQAFVFSWNISHFPGSSLPVFVA